MGSKKAAIAGVGGIVGEGILMAIEAYTGRITLTKWKECCIINFKVNYFQVTKGEAQCRKYSLVEKRSLQT